MASIKRVTGNYDIYANVLTIHGNLQVAGTTTTVNTEIINQDEIITGNLTVSGPLYAGGNKGTNGQVLTSNGNGVIWGAAGGTAAAGGSTNNIQYNSSTVLTGSSNFNYFAANGNVQVGTTLIANNSTIGTYNNTDLVLYADGTGHLFVQDVIKMQYQTGATPTNVASTVQLLANTPGSGGSGLFVVNSSTSDELATKAKALVYSIIFG